MLSRRTSKCASSWGGSLSALFTPSIIAISCSFASCLEDGSTKPLYW